MKNLQPALTYTPPPPIIFQREYFLYLRTFILFFCDTKKRFFIL